MATYQGPNGWTADSVVGAINAAAQAPIRAEDLLTSTGDARDETLNSRKWLNAYTGVRDPAVIGSVYAQGDTPAWLANEVAALNAEQALRRSAQAEVFNKVFEKASGGSLPWLEVLRAAVLQPGVEAGFGSQIVDPAIGQAAKMEAEAKKQAAGAYAGTLNDAIAQRRAALAEANKPKTIFDTGWSVNPRTDTASNYRDASQGANQVAAAVFGTNPFANYQGYIGSGGGGGSAGNSVINAQPTGYVRGPATTGAYSWGGGYVGPTQFSVDNPAYNTYAGSNFLRPGSTTNARTITPTWVR